MTGIAITLATREDGEAVSRIEKLIGHKIPRVDQADKETQAPPATVSDEKPAKPRRAAKPRKSEAADKPAPKAPKRQAEEPARADQLAERSPIVEDLKSDWNGPMPSFLSVSAG
jgi:superfamily II DNA/RNA helicase